MLRSEILSIISQGEGAKIEFKRDDVRAESLAKEIVAFANMNGGCILLGVADDGNICGIQREDLQLWVMDTVVGRHIHPFILPDYEEIDIEGKKIAVLTVAMGAAKPYMLKHNDREDIYVRYGNTCQLATREQQARLFESGGLISAEKFPVHGSSREELDKRRYQEYFGEILDNQQIQDWDTLLTNRSFLVGDQSSLCCSYFAYALFSKNPRHRLPQSGARVTVFPGNENEQDYPTLMDEILSLPLVELRGETAESPVEPSLHDKVIDLLKPHITREYLQGSTRKRDWDYPRDAIRELLVNAFIHRDWTKQNCVRVEVYGNRMEVISPGALPNSMTVEKIKDGEQSQRNPACIRIFRDYGYLEDRGMGIRRKVIPLTKKYTGKEPSFESTEEHFKVTLWKKDSES